MKHVNNLIAVAHTLVDIPLKDLQMSSFDAGSYYLPHTIAYSMGHISIYTVFHRKRGSFVIITLETLVSFL